MDEFAKNFWSWFNEKTTSPWWGVYTASFLLWNWKLFYVLFFDPQENYEVPKIEYVKEFVIPYIGFVDLFLGPFCASLFFILIFPHFTNWLHKTSLKFFFDRKSYFGLMETEYEEKKQVEVEEIQKLKKERIEALNEVKKLNQKLAEQEAEIVKTEQNKKGTAKFVISEANNELQLDFYLGDEKLLELSGINSVAKAEDTIKEIKEHIDTNARIINREDQDGSFYFIINGYGDKALAFSVNKKSKIELAKVLRKVRNNVHEAEIILQE